MLQCVSSSRAELGLCASKLHGYVSTKYKQMRFIAPIRDHKGKQHRNTPESVANASHTLKEGGLELDARVAVLSAT